MKKKLVFLVKLGIVILLFLIIFRPETFGMAGLFGNIGPMDVWNALREASTTGPVSFFFFMGCATAVKLLGIFSGIIRWRFLLAAQGIRMPFLFMTYQWFMGRAIGLLLPGTLGLDGYRLVESSRYTREVVKCATVIAVEKLTGIIALSFLVFLTFPLGFKYLQFNIVLLVAIMGVLLLFVICSLLLLLNPRVIQVIAAVLPVPSFARGAINKLGRAATAYSHSKGSLLAALFFGLLVHLGTCSKYFFTFMAIRAENVAAADIFFVSPLMITASVLAFTISGLGVREIAFGLVLGASAGHAVAVLGGHLGLWAGEIIPFALSVPLLLFGGRPSKESIEKDRAYVAENLVVREAELKPLLDWEEVNRYRREMITLLTCGAAAGLLAGAAVAILESLWILWKIAGLEQWGLFPWGMIAYGFIFACGGIAVAGIVLFVSLLLDRFMQWTVSFAFSYAAIFAAGALVITVFRFQRDILAGHTLTLRQLGILVCLISGVAIVLGVIAFLKTEFFRVRLISRVPVFIAACVASWLCMIGIAWGIVSLAAPKPAPIAFTPTVRSQGPNIVLCTIDALRADYLPLYNPKAQAKTPALVSLANDGVLFTNAFAQASWTKPSFATLFTGLYPSAHGATSKTAALSPSVETLAEILQRGGYYTKGFANNPNMAALFGLNRGFVDYVELKPNPLFGATSEAMHLSLYSVLRKVFMIAEGRLRRGRLRITDFYQPANVVTDEALQWLDSSDRPSDIPFYLYLHYMETHDPFMDHSRPGIGYARARMENPDPERFLDSMRQAYISEIEFLDLHLARLFQGLKARGLYDNTIIVLVSDHGEEFYDHNGWWHGQTLYEELLRIPLIIKLPENRAAGSTNLHLARLIDVPLTLLKIVGLPPNGSMAGVALCDASGMPSNAATAYSFAENDFEGNIQQSVRTLTHALIKANENNTRKTEPIEFYDMVEDPQQQRNLAHQPKYNELIEELAEVIGQYIRAIFENAPEPGHDVEINPQLRQQLESIGYM